MSAGASEKLFRVRLASGRELGPIGLDRVEKLIQKGHITGKEVARELPDPNWVPLTSIPDLNQLILSINQKKISKRFGDSAEEIIGTAIMEAPPQPILREPSFTELEEPTKIVKVGPEAQDDEPTKMHVPVTLQVTKTESNAPEPPAFYIKKEISEEKTKFLELPKELEPRSKKKQPSAIVGIAAAVIVMALLNEFLTEEPPPVKKQSISERSLIRAKMPVTKYGVSDPKKSIESYQEGLKEYLKDHLDGYKKAAAHFSDAISLDNQNSKAQAMLASSYLNMFESSNKDETYFSVIIKLIENSRSNSVELTETVLAEVELFLALGRRDSAYERIVDFTKTHQNRDPAMYYYLAASLYEKGSFSEAARFLSIVAEQNAFSAKIHFLKGRIAEALNHLPEALQEYEQAVKVNEYHAKSRLRISEIYFEQGRVRDSLPHLKFLTTNSALLAVRDQAIVHLLMAKHHGIEKKWDEATQQIELAYEMDKTNSDIKMEYYSLREQKGQKVENSKNTARMYAFLKSGEEKVKKGEYQKALTDFLEARQADPSSIEPLVKAGEMFRQLNNNSNALINYKKAIEINPKDDVIYGRYIDSLINNYEWDDAKISLKKWQERKGPQSTIDRLNGVLYFKQNLFNEALVAFRKSMSRDSIDPEVYVSYSKALMSAGAYKEALNFWSIARRLAPGDIEILVGMAECIGETENLERGVRFLQDETIRRVGPQVEMIAAIADLQFRKGDLDNAVKNADEAIRLNPDSPLAWKVKAKWYAANEHKDKRAIDLAIEAFKAYSDRNPSDPSGYLERYHLLIKKGKFNDAITELNRIFAIYPRYPGIHFYRGESYAKAGQFEQAIEEFQVELKNNPNSIMNLIGYGKVLMETGNAKDALPHLVKAMQLSPQSAEAKQQVAYANHLSKNYGAAIALYQNAIQLDPGNPIIHKRLGLSYRAAGDTAGARRAFKKYLELAPDAPDAAEFEGY